LGLIFLAILTLLSSQATAQTIDHFKCYEADGDDLVNVNVNLQDQFGVESGVSVEAPELFCNPVDKNSEGFVDETAHLAGYEISDDDSERIVIVSNQFGEQTLELEGSGLLFVPSTKNGVGVFSDLNLDHFKCYEADGVPVNVAVNLRDQFGFAMAVLVGEPELFCTPVNKNGGGVMEPDADLTCYAIDDDQGGQQVVVVDNQFAMQNLELDDPEMLCVPEIPANKIVFVTSMVFDGNLGGLAGAGAKCNAAAAAPTPSLPGTYTAWLSSSTVPARDRVTQATVPYVRTDGIKVANDYADLTDCTGSCLQNRINRDEFGVVHVAANWTNTREDGTALGRHCTDWTSAGSDRGGIGNLSQTNFTWTRVGSILCSSSNVRLTCFQD
jgi:hypothetical protein